jgi:hypothetical protein
MKMLLRAACLTLPFLAAGSLARADWCPPVHFDAGINAHISGHWGGVNGGPQAGPWYTYFPYNAYFQTPAPIGGWPWWPSATVAVPPPLTVPTTVKPVTYYGAPPSYWYERK